jgi:hypothetical protein
MSPWGPAKVFQAISTLESVVMSRTSGVEGSRSDRARAHRHSSFHCVSPVWRLSQASWSFAAGW